MPEVHSRICPRCGWVELFPNPSIVTCPICSQNLIETDTNIMMSFGINMIEQIEKLRNRYVKNSSVFSQKMWDKRVKYEADTTAKIKDEKKAINDGNLNICPQCGVLADYRAAKCPYCKVTTVNTGLQFSEWKKLSEKGKRNKKRELMEKICYYNPLFSHADWIKHALDEGKINTPFGSCITYDYIDAQELLNARCPFCGSTEIQYINNKSCFAKFMAGDPKKMLCLQCKKIIK